MPCNAIARQTATVALDAGLITQDEQAFTAVGVLLEQMFGQELQTSFVSWFRGQRIAEWQIAGLQIRIWQDGRVEVLARRRDPQRVKQIEALLNQVAGARFQRKARAAIARRYAVTEQRTAQNGALVLTVNL